jgi:MoxR-like ATPase
VEPVLSGEEVAALQDETERVQVEESVLDYLMAVVAATRTSPLLALGVSPRGSRALLRAAQAAALADGRQYVVPDDVKRLSLPVLAHRVVPRSAAVDGDAAIQVIAQEIPVPR